MKYLHSVVAGARRVYLPTSERTNDPMRRWLRPTSPDSSHSIVPERSY